VTVWSALVIDTGSFDWILGWTCCAGWEIGDYQSRCLRNRSAARKSAVARFTASLLSKSVRALATDQLANLRRFTWQNRNVLR
jgi:hypothetical protein